MFNKMRSLIYIIYLISTIFLIQNAHAVTLNSDIRKIDRYFSKIRTIESHFIQRASSFPTKEGFLYLQKPDLVRIEYIYPEKEVLIVNDKLAQYHIVDLDQTNLFKPNSPVISLLSKKGFSIINDSYITDFKSDDDLYTISFSPNIFEQNIVITLKFLKNPMELMNISSEIDDLYFEMQFINPKINKQINSRYFSFDNFDIKSTIK